MSGSSGTPGGCHVGGAGASSARRRSAMLGSRHPLEVPMHSTCSLRVCISRSAARCSRVALPARADETCQSPYLPRLVGQEDFVYVWTLGIEGVGDGSDKLVTIGANPGARATARSSRASRSAAATRRTTAGPPTTAATSGSAASTTAGSSSSTWRAIRRTRSSCARSATSRRRPAAWWVPTASTRSRAAC